MKKMFTLGSMQLIKGRIGAAFLALICVFLILSALPATVSNTNSPLIGAMRLVLLVFACWSLLWSVFITLTYQLTRLVVSPEGVVFHSLGIEIFTSWDNIEQFTRQQGKWGLLSFSVDGLILRQPVRQQRRPWGIVIMWWMPLISVGKEHRFFPLGTFSRWSDPIEVEREFRKYAPQIFSHRR